jgi:hypothetical protein
MNLKYNPYYPYGTRQEYKYIQCGIRKLDMKTYYDNMLKQETTSVYFPSFNNGDGIQKLVASVPDDLALREWELYTLENMELNDNY